MARNEQRHPEDSDDWAEYANNPDNWTIPTPPPGDEAGEPDGVRGDGGVGPYGAFQPPWADYDERDPNPPRESTPYDETSPLTNHAAWRYQQDPYRGDQEEHRSDFRFIIVGGIALGLALVALAFLFG